MPTYPIKVGKRARFRCDTCSTEFEILHEPDYQDPAMARSFGGRSKKVEWCPFCGIDDTMLVREEVTS